MLLVQKYLLTHSFADLIKEHGVYASFSKSAQKFSLNYDQVESKESDLLAQECRGLILTASDNRIFDPKHQLHIPGQTRILAFPLKRFFNHGQGCAATINWNDSGLVIQEKLDGSLCIAYYDDIINQWCIATRSVPNADIPLTNGWTFRSLFEKAVQENYQLSFEDFCQNLEQGFTYCFELTSFYNRVVVNYPDTKITLLAVRDNYTYQELPLDHPVAQKIKSPEIKEYKFNNLEDLVSWVSTLNPLEHEGVVIKDSFFRRLKIKNAAYIVYNKLHDTLGTSDRNCLEMILLEKEDDAIPFMPKEIADNLLKIKDKFRLMMQDHEETYLKIKKIADATLPGDKKTFALLVVQHKQYWSAPFFQIFDQKVKNMKDFIHQARKDGTWGANFLDKILDVIKNY